MATLEAFAKKAESEREFRCRTCRLKREQPELWQELLNGRARPRPITYLTIVQWLRDDHREVVTVNQLRDHFVLGHEEAR